tara:strand:+ start:50 stop:454 length:405 start_codon:yes stop_codon:yes gene_type:complete
VKIVKLTDEDDSSYLDKAEIIKIGTLKLAGDRRFVKGIGMQDGEFFLLVESPEDEEYVGFIVKEYGPHGLALGDFLDAWREKAICREIPKDSSLVFFKYVKGKKHLFRTSFDFSVNGVVNTDTLESFTSPFTGE